MCAKGNVDPELERLRQEVAGPPNLDAVALNIQSATARIHASYLFEHIGKPTLQKLCLLLSSTASGKTYSGWQEFAAHMGLTMEQIRCIDYDFKGMQDPTYYVLLAYAQHVGATIDKIFGALQKMHRLDVINQIKDSIFYLINAISQNTVVDESTILRSKTIPTAPLVLTPMDVTQKIQTRTTDSGHVSQDSLQKTKQDCGSTVMLTFADDGLETARHIAKIFRSKEPKIGVVILQEQENHVYSKAEEFIDSCYKQVKFIIPILTKGYMEKLNNPMISIEDQNKLDTKYIKYIYSLLRCEYVKNQCINYRVRCIVPDKEISTVIRAIMHPTFQAWFRESNIDEFVENILLRKYSKKYFTTCTNRE